MRFLILAHLGDQTALHVASVLRSRHGPEEVQLASAEELAMAARWEHRQEPGRTVTKIESAGGWTYDSEAGTVVFNRLLGVTAPHFSTAKAGDREYAERELTALFLSWLEALGPRVVNRPSPLGLGAESRNLLEWLNLAARSGLPTRGIRISTDPRWDSEPSFVPTANPRPFAPLREPTCYLEPLATERQSLLIVGQEVLGDLSEAWAEEAKALSTRLGCDLMEIVFSPISGGPTPTRPQDWRVTGATSFPCLRSSASVGAVADLLEEKSRCAVGIAEASS